MMGKNIINQHGGVRAYVRDRYSEAIRRRMVCSLNDYLLYFEEYYSRCSSYEKSREYAVKHCLFSSALEITTELRERFGTHTTLVYEIYSDILSTLGYQTGYPTFMGHIKRILINHEDLRTVIINNRVDNHMSSFPALTMAVISEMVLLKFPITEIYNYITGPYTERHLHGTGWLPSRSWIVKTVVAICSHPFIPWIRKYIAKQDRCV